MVEPILYDNMEKAPTESNLYITSNDINIELSMEFLVELRKNIYHGTYNEDLVDHIDKALQMVYLIYVPGVDFHQLRMEVFPLSLADDAKEWWIRIVQRFANQVQRVELSVYGDSDLVVSLGMCYFQRAGLVEVHSGRNGELITIFDAVKPSLDECSALWLSKSRICDALAEVPANMFRSSFRDGLRESVSHLLILTDSIILVFVLSSLAEVRYIDVHLLYFKASYSRISLVSDEEP
ncbi:hypothetical protein Tco_0877837 [Tanacetum coccineum]|uniref:Uncharacterized protein n=1 Tax=Tanacetum coccineum TaxID=301880 RepID=A0ABQ5BW95_9ASTR